MDISTLFLLVGIAIFPAYQAHQCCRHGKIVLGVLIVVPLVILFIIPFADRSAHVGYMGFVYLMTFIPTVLSFFLLKNAPVAKGSILQAASFVGGISLLVMIGVLFIALNRYTFIKQSEYKVKVYDRWTGSQKP